MKNIIEKIKQWVYENHEHHYGSEHISIDLSKMTTTSSDDGETLCVDGDYPYVNSAKLMEFLEQLVKHELNISNGNNKTRSKNISD